MQPALVALGWGSNKVLPKPNDPPRFLGQAARMLFVCFALLCSALHDSGCMGETLYIVHSMVHMVHAALVPAHSVHIIESLADMR
jgi:hypothetical protein